MMLPIVEFWIWKDGLTGQFKEPHTGIILHWYESNDVAIMDCKTKLLYRLPLTPQTTKVLGFRQSMELFDGQP